MCTEFLLALIYFSIIFIINYLLVKLLLSYQRNFFSLLKLKMILNSFEKKSLNLLLCLENRKKKNLKIPFLIGDLKKFSNTKDILIIGNTYKSFTNNKSNINSIDFYFPLLEQQYLS